MSLNKTTNQLFFTINDQPYPTFRAPPDLLPFDVSLALLLVGSMSRLCIFIATAWDGVHAILAHFIFCWRRDSEVIFSKSRAYSRMWSWYNIDNISFESFRLGLWLRANRLWRVLGYYSRSFDPDFLEPMLCSLGRCCDGSCLYDSSFLLDMHRCHY